jgi:TRAP-type uncharacterized transport system fused permease subunit
MNNTQLTLWGIAAKKFIPGIAWFFLILVLVCTPGKDLPKVGDWFSLLDIDKLIHMGIFGVLAFLFMYPFLKSDLPKKQQWYYCIKIAIATCIYGYLTELIQKYYIPGRSYDMIDFASDGIGGIVALVFSKIFFLKSSTAR